MTHDEAVLMARKLNENCAIHGAWQTPLGSTGEYVVDLTTASGEHHQFHTPLVWLETPRTLNQDVSGPARSALDQILDEDE